MRNGALDAGDVARIPAPSLDVASVVLASRNLAALGSLKVEASRKAAVRVLALNG